MKEKRLVVYTDGSAKDGITGYGLHGYYGELTETLTAACPGQVATRHGYMLRKDALTFYENTDGYINVEKYIDVSDYLVEDTTNNMSELTALTEALLLGLELEAESVVIFTDSEYCRKGLTDWLNIWIKNNWIKKDGTSVKNKEHWVKIVALRDTYESKDMQLSIEWVKGHAGHTGNVIADTLCGVGANRNRANKPGTKVITEITKALDTSKYWKGEAIRDPLLSFKFNIFLSGTAVPGLYYMVDPIKSDIYDVGKKLPGTGYSVVKMNDQDKSIEIVHDLVNKDSDIINSLEYIHMDKLFSKMRSRDLMTHGKYVFNKPSSARFNYKYVGHMDKVIDEINPVGLVFLGLTRFNVIEEILNLFLTDNITGKDRFNTVIEDVTKYVFPEVNNKITLLQTMIVGSKFIRLPVPRTTGSTMRFSLGKELPNRNALSKMLKQHPEVHMVSWVLEPGSINYGTIVKTDMGVGIFTNYNTSILLK
jgi:ribonuclease HI